MFGRQAYVGMSSEFGTVTLGRQYDSVVDYLGSFSAAGIWGGTYFSHVVGNDNLNNDFSIANAVKYQSSKFAGFTFGGLYGFSNQAGAFAVNRAYSVGVGYSNDPLKAGVAYMQGNGINATTTGAISGEQFAGSLQRDFLNEFGVPLAIDRQRTFGAGASSSMDAMTFGAVWTQSRRTTPRSSQVSNVVNNFELNARYMLTPALAIGAAYTYSQEKLTARGDSTDKFKIHQFGVQADYALSKRTDFHIETVAQIGSASGDSAPLPASIANSNGAFGPSSSSRQVLVNTGIRHRF